MLVVGVPVMVGGVFAVTVMSNAAKLTVALPSVTLMTMPLVTPLWATVGVPLSLPVAASKVAHAGLLVILNVSLSLSASAAVGVNR